MRQCEKNIKEITFYTFIEYARWQQYIQ